MATAASLHPRRPVTAVATIDRVLAVGAVAMAIVLALALLRGWARLAQVPPVIAFHLLTIGCALLLTPFVLLRRRGDRRHRQLGYTWVASLGATAIASLFIRTINGGFSPIHILSIATLIGLFVIVTSARAHNHARHRRTVRQVTAGALLLAGIFTFVPSRMLGGFLFG